MRLVIDSNILVSALDPADKFHTECIPIFNSLLAFQTEAICPISVLAETVCALSRRISDDQISRSVYRSLAALPAINWLDVDSSVVKRACALGIKSKVRGGDALVLQVAFHYGIPLVTKDKELKNRAPRRIQVYDPSEVPLDRIDLR